MGEALKRIRCQQRKWAGEEEIGISSKDYCRKLKDNLFQNLDKDTRHDFEDGDGNELYGNMNAIHSSSALVCNFFDYWRGKNSASLADALGAGKVRRICFEHKFPTGMSKPNLDVVLFCDDGTVFAIESKFAEPFRGKKKNSLKKYFSRESEIWKNSDLDRCQDIAQKLHNGELRFRHLDAAQLLKHMLGLAKWGKESGKNWTLLYLWFNPGELGGSEAKCHECEIKQFINEVSHDGLNVGGGGTICTMTYQVLFRKLFRELGDSHKEYKKYLCQRYFPEKLKPCN